MSTSPDCADHIERQRRALDMATLGGEATHRELLQQWAVTHTAGAASRNEEPSIALFAV